MSSIEQPHDELPVHPSDVWDNLGPKYQESALRLLAKMAYELVICRRGRVICGSDNELPKDD
jgi:hypothetical protein